MKIAWIRGDRVIQVREYEGTDIAQCPHPQSMQVVEVPPDVAVERRWTYANGAFTAPQERPLRPIRASRPERSREGGPSHLRTPDEMHVRPPHGDPHPHDGPHDGPHPHVKPPAPPVVAAPAVAPPVVEAPAVAPPVVEAPVVAPAAPEVPVAAPAVVEAPVVVEAPAAAVVVETPKPD